MAAYYEGLAGFKPQEIADGLHGIVVAAEASGEPIKRVSDIMTDAVTQFGDGAAAMDRYADVFAATATGANTTIGQMGYALKYVGPVAGSLSYGLEDVAVSLGLIADAGIKGSQAGTSLRNIYNRLATNAGAEYDIMGELIQPGARDIIEDLGVSFYDAYGKARPWLEFLTDAREAWRALDSDRAAELAAAFGDIGLEGTTAEDIMADFVTNLDDWRTQWNKLKTDAERTEFADRLKDDFEALGVSFYDDAGYLRTFTDVARDAELRLGSMSDQERQTAAKKIGSLRGIAAWLRLMSATEDEYLTLMEEVYNSTGAADRMREMMYDNLYGDIVHFNAALDVLRDTIYYDVDSPLRDVAQYGTDALNRITKAVSEKGLAGGLSQLSDEILHFGTDYHAELTELGNATSELLTILLTEIGPTIFDTAVILGSGFAEGLLKGIAKNLPKGMANLLGINLEGEEAPTPEIYARSLVGLGVDEPLGTTAYDGVEIPVDVIAQVDPEQLRSNVQAAIDNGSGYVEIGDGYIVSADAANEIANDVENGMYEGIENTASSLENELTAVGPTVGASLASDISAQIGSGSYFIDVIANVLPVGGGWKMERYAKSMSGGTILQGATVFGMNRDGQPLVGGEAGPEAIVGTGSLGRMIQSSVRSSMSELMDRLDEVAGRVSTYSPRIYLYPDTLVGGIAPNMNGELSDIADWKGYGRV